MKAKTRAIRIATADKEIQRLREKIPALQARLKFQVEKREGLIRTPVDDPENIELTILTVVQPSNQSVTQS